jgi:hypothetical protein
MQAIESVMDRIPMKDRDRVGKLILLWRVTVLKNDESATLTHTKVCSSYLSIRIN